MWSEQNFMGSHSEFFCVPRVPSQNQHSNMIYNPKTTSCFEHLSGCLATRSLFKYCQDDKFCIWEGKKYFFCRRRIVFTFLICPLMKRVQSSVSCKITSFLRVLLFKCSNQKFNNSTWYSFIFKNRGQFKPCFKLVSSPKNLSATSHGVCVFVKE